MSKFIQYGTISTQNETKLNIKKYFLLQISNYWF